MEKQPLDSLEDDWTAEIGPYFQNIKMGSGLKSWKWVEPRNKLGLSIIGLSIILLSPIFILLFVGI